MSVTPDQILKLAFQLRSEKEGEVWWRASVGRAYYAGFHACRIVAEGRGFRPPSDGSVHEALIRFLEGYADKDQTEANRMKSLAVQLRRGRGLRTRADYDLKADFPLIYAQQSATFATAIMNQIARL